MKPTILVIDDDPIILDMYELVLGEEYQLYTATCGQEALTVLDAHPRIDVVLSDIVMPQMDGYETCRRIRENPAFAHIKIILVSSKMHLEDRLAGYQVGADDYITKPFEASELLAKIKVFLRLKNAEEIDQIKNNFISLVNHEARTPLTAIFGFAELLQLSPGLTEQDQLFVQKILDAAKTLLRSSEKTVLLSNLKSGNVVLLQRRIELKKLLARLLKDVDKEAKSKQVAVQMQVAEELDFTGDVKLMRAALEVLIENAVKYARDRSVVRITAKRTDERTEIEVANNGEQIAASDLEKIFDEMTALDVEHHQKGQCLSLAIARRIVEAHEGTLTAHNDADGPVFTLRVKN